MSAFGGGFGGFGQNNNQQQNTGFGGFGANTNTNTGMSDPLLPLESILPCDALYWGTQEISPNPSLTRILSARYRNRIWFYSKYRRLWQHEYNWWRTLRWWVYWLWKHWRYVDDAFLCWNVLLVSTSHDAISNLDITSNLASIVHLFLACLLQWILE